MSELILLIATSLVIFALEITGQILDIIILVIIFAPMVCPGRMDEIVSKGHWGFRALPRKRSLEDLPCRDRARA